MTKSLLVLSFTTVTGTAWSQLPDSPGRDVTVEICGKCHSTDVLVAHRQTRDQWTETMLKMIDLGALGSEDQFNAILQYLTRNFGPQATLVNVNKASTSELENGLGIPTKEADAIVSYRKEKGSFKAIEDLKKVPGLDFKKIEAAKDRLAFQ
jgi:competence protein ComEA